MRFWCKISKYVVSHTQKSQNSQKGKIPLARRSPRISAVFRGWGKWGERFCYLSSLFDFVTTFVKREKSKNFFLCGAVVVAFSGQVGSCPSCPEFLRFFAVRLGGWGFQRASGCRSEKLPHQLPRLPPALALASSVCVGAVFACVFPGVASGRVCGRPLPVLRPAVVRWCGCAILGRSWLKGGAGAPEKKRGRFRLDGVGGGVCSNKTAAAKKVVAKSSGV